MGKQENEEEQSELDLDSDRASRKTRKSSPNRTLIRTGEAGKSGKAVRTGP
ncbi:MAG: hypothetical protein WAM95_12025 [Bacillus sp. (in: firmicutes)]